MSMLAEKKSKQKWSLNPRGNDWSKDTNKFGQKMLEKMGWTPGKGLGAKEDGLTEHVKVKYKNDSNGIGFQLRDDQWTQHESQFTQLLAKLGDSTSTTKLDLPKAEKSLEKKSQKSRARVHYHKFTRSKDLAIRSERDLANIFGRKTLDVDQRIDKENSENKETPSFGVVTVQSGNMADYFKSKFNKLSNSFLSTNNKVKDDELRSEMCTIGFGFSSENSEENQKQSFVNFVSPFVQKFEESTSKQTKIKEDGNFSKKAKSKKNKKKKLAFENKGIDINISEEVCFDNPCLNNEDNFEEQISKKDGLDNFAFDSNDDKKPRKSVTFASPLAEYSIINYNSPKKSKKMKKKHIKGIDNPVCEDFTFEEISPLKKKRKSTDNSEETPVKKKKKHFENGIDNPACEDFTFEEIPSLKKKRKSIDNSEETPVKKKKKHFENGIENLACEEYSFEELSTDAPTEEKKKTKKKKRKSLENGISNLACDISSSLNSADNLACSVNLIEEGVASITNAIDNYQNELENEINLKKDKKIQKQKKNKKEI